MGVGVFCLGEVIGWLSAASSVTQRGLRCGWVTLGQCQMFYEFKITKMALFVESLRAAKRSSWEVVKSARIAGEDYPGRHSYRMGRGCQRA